MASNFLNSSGTDLDDLFYVNNSNAGALGFLMYNGQDLGNRYPSGSLGYNVGYKNSAGTDIGYLRCKLVAPTATMVLNTSNVKTKAWEGSGCSDTSGDGYSSHTCDTYYGKGVLSPVITITNGMPVTSVNWYLEAYYNPNNDYSPNLYIHLNFNSTVVPYYEYGEYGECPCELYAYDYTTTTTFDTIYAWVRTSSLGTTNGLSTNIGVACRGSQPLEIYLRVSAYVSNSIGGNWVTSPSMRIFKR